MRRAYRRVERVGWGILFICAAYGRPAWAEEPAGSSPLTVCQLVRMSCEELEALYRGGTAPSAPIGAVRGTAIPSPGSRLTPARSKAATFMWQGKVFNPIRNTATNKFFGMRVVKAKVYSGESWVDGNPALILDYSQTSHVYANVRDEIREITPGLYLGAMYERRCDGPALKMFFVLESEPLCE